MRMLNVAALGCALLAACHSLHAANPSPPTTVVIPAINTIIKTKSGYSIAIDRSTQSLCVELEQPESLHANAVARRTVEVITDYAPVQLPGEVVTRLRQGRIVYTRAEKGNWVYVHLLDGGKLLDGWIHKQYLRPRPPDQHAALQKDPIRADGEFVSAAMLIQKGKQFDDGLYAAVEVAMQNGLGPITGKKDWLRALAESVNPEIGGSSLANLYAAIQFGGQSITVPETLRRLVEKSRNDFQANELRSKPLGFYNWSPELEQIFRQDRLLQSPAGMKSPTGVIAVAEALARDAKVRRSYEQNLGLAERLTNPLSEPDFRSLFADVDARRAVQLAPDKAIHFLPPSDSQETRLLNRLFPGSSPPPGFVLMEEIIKQLKQGQLSFEPTEKSGWYDHQLWSLEPLVRFNKTSEAQRLHPNDRYRLHLEGLFKGSYALMRETHVKQLGPYVMAAIQQPRKEREKVNIAPDPHVELLPTMYLRRADSYRFVRAVLEKTFGREHVKQMHRLTIDGPVKMDLAAELDWMVDLFQGAHVTACRDLGMPDDFADRAIADQQAMTFLRWTSSLSADPDLATDVRMMVPVFFDQQRQKTKVWLFLGWQNSSCTIKYNRVPGIKITDTRGTTVSHDEGPEVIFPPSDRQLATPIFAEVYVTKLLNRAGFRRHCDVYQTKAAIMGNLE